MCMFVPRDRKKSLKPKVAEEDIKCFKIVAIGNEKNIYSAVRKFPYQLNKTYTVEGNFFEIFYTGHYYYHIDGGGFHSFVELEDAFDSYGRYESTDEEKMVIVRCHIPKGSLCYMGESLGGEPNYVSQSIVIDKIIHDN